MKTDIEIAREAKLNKIADIANGLGIAADDVIPYGNYIAKIPYSVINDEKVKKIILFSLPQLLRQRRESVKPLFQSGLLSV